MAGLDSTGFVSKDVDTIIAELEANEKAAFGQSLNVRPTSVMGVINGIMGTKFSELWDVANDVWASQNPDTAQGVSLDQLCQLTGVIRESARQSTVTLSLSGTDGTVIPALRRVKNTSTGTYWTNAASATLAGDPTPTSVAFVSEDYGEIIGLAGTLTVIDTPVSGWESVTNAADATLGQEGETDAELRIRRASLLTSTGNGTVDAIKARVAAIEGIFAVEVFENTSPSTDANGLPAHSFEVVIDNDTALSSTIGQAIWKSKPAGISAYGSATAAAVDVNGGARIVAYTPATLDLVYLSVTAVTGTGFSASAAFVTAYDAYGAGLGIGDDVAYNALIARSFVDGVTNVTGLKINFNASPTGTSDLAVGIRERARFDSSRVIVTLA